MSSMRLLLASLIAVVSAGQVTLESVPSLPDGWTVGSQALDANKDISFSISLRQPKLDGIGSLLTPGSKHLSQAEIQELRAPDQADVDSVMKWLDGAGIKDAKAKDDWIHVKTSITEAEKLLSADLKTYTYDNKVSVIRTREYKVPDSLSKAISFIHPISNFMKPVRDAMPIEQGEGDSFHSNAAAPCGSSVTPTCLRKLYNITYKPADNTPKARLAISGYLEQNPSHRDAASFFSKYAPELKGYDFKVQTVNGGKDPESNPGVEAMLDIEYAMAIGYPAATTFYATGGRGDKLDDNGKPITGSGDDNEPYLAFVEYLLGLSDDQVPHVLSVSYGDDELTVPLAYAQKVCTNYGLLSKRGTTVVHSSGDGGSTGGQQGNCRSKDGKHTKTTMATFPAGCPWVTAVGGTVNTAEPPSGISFSSGGFSAYFPREAWQDAAVKKYQSSIGNLLSGYYNTSGQGIPDISAVSNAFSVVLNGQTTSVGGTSASAPVVAGMLALVNDARLRAGKQSLGFINEILYSDKVQAVLQDITSGTSYACDFASSGWPAKAGWDAITGLGVPKDFQKFMDVLVAA